MPVAVKLEDFGGKPDADISDALEKAAAAAAGKGAVLIGPGNYFLDRPVLITSTGVVLRGSGKDQTKLVFRWEPAKDTVDFIGIRDGDTIPPQKTIYAAARGRGSASRPTTGSRPRCSSRAKTRCAQARNTQTDAPL